MGGFSKGQKTTTGLLLCCRHGVGKKVTSFMTTLTTALCLSIALIPTSYYHVKSDSDEPVSYKTRDAIPLVANTVRPYDNPTETYQYYKLPFCRPKETNWDEHDLGELLTGSRKVLTDYKIYFAIDQKYAVLCRLNMQLTTPPQNDNVAVLKAFMDALDEEYIFEMYLDDIRLHGRIGTVYQQSVTESSYFLNTHLHFDIAYNGPMSHLEVGNIVDSQIVGANVSTLDTPDAEYDSDNKYLLSEANIQKNPEAVFTYSVTWHHQPDSKWEDRNTPSVFAPEDLEIHWLSVVNSFVLVMLLMSFLSIILFRILKQDFSRYMDVSETSEMVSTQKEETGWKLVHADVFRAPSFMIFFTAFNGAGAQLFVMLFGVIVCSLLGIFTPTKRGGVATAIIVLYALTSFVGGYVSARMYRQLRGTNWVWNIVLASMVIPGPLLVIFAFLNSVAIWNDSSAALPFGTIMILIGLFFLVTVPLTILGGIMGRNTAVDFEAPCRTSKIPREIPQVAIYGRPIAQILMGGFLPFSAVYIELHHIFSAIWGRQIYTLFGILFLSLVMLVCVTMTMTVTMTYFQLTLEDHQWWWRSFFSGGITGLFIMFYSVWYYMTSSEMTGFFQSAFYFGYTAMMAYCFFIMLGFVGFTASLAFVKKIYRTIKVE